MINNINIKDSHQFKNKYYELKKENPNKKIILYIKNAKTAGRQTVKLLNKYLPNEYLIMNPVYIQKIFIDNYDLIKECYIISTVRNPYYRYLSGSFHLNLNIPTNINKKETNMLIYKHIHISQYDTISYKNKLITDFIIYHENYYENICELFKYLNIKLDNNDHYKLKNYKNKNKKYELIIKQNPTIKDSLKKKFYNDFKYIYNQ